MWVLNRCAASGHHEGQADIKGGALAAWLCEASPPRRVRTYARSRAFEGKKRPGGPGTARRPAANFEHNKDVGGPPARRRSAEIAPGLCYALVRSDTFEGMKAELRGPPPLSWWSKFASRVALRRGVHLNALRFPQAPHKTEARPPKGAGVCAHRGAGLWYNPVRAGSIDNFKRGGAFLGRRVLGEWRAVVSED